MRPAEDQAGSSSGLAKNLEDWNLDISVGMHNCHTAKCTTNTTLKLIGEEGLGKFSVSLKKLCV